MSAKPNGILPANGTPRTPDSEDWESMSDSGELDASLDKLSIQPGPTRPYQPQPPVTLYGDDPRTQYRPPEPVIKIMKRPDSGSSGQNGQAKPRVEQKSLKQREQEYAEARQRILGNDSKPDSSQAKTPSKSVISKNRKDNVNGARHPKGPDGSKGFQSKR